MKDYSASHHRSLQAVHGPITDLREIHKIRTTVDSSVSFEMSSVLFVASCHSTSPVVASLHSDATPTGTRCADFSEDTIWPK